MGAESDTVVSEEYILDFATIVCDQAGGSKSYLRINGEECGIMHSKGMNAHEKSCAAFKNIMPFPVCYSPKYLETITTLLSSGAPQMKARRDEFVRYKEEAEQYRSNGIYKGTCILALLDKWFDADEKMVLEENRELMNELQEAIEAPSGLALISIRRKTENLLGRLIRETGKDKEYDTIWGLLNNQQIKDKVEHLFDLQETYSERVFLIETVNYDGDLYELGALSRTLNDLVDGISIIRSIFYPKEADTCDEMINELNKYKDRIDIRRGRLSTWEKETYHLLTMDSFLVCRCGGVITFRNSGQEHAKPEKVLLNRLIELIDRSIAIHQINYETKVRLTETREAETLKKAIRQFQYLREYALSSEAEEKKASEVPIFIQNVSESYYEEASKMLMGILSIAAMASGAVLPQVAVALYDATGSIPELFSVKDTKTDTSDAHEWEADTTGLSYLNDGITIADPLLNLGKETGILNNGLGTVLAVGNFFYISDETWVKAMRITIFVDNYAFISEQSLNEYIERVPFYDSDIGYGEYKIIYKEKVDYNADMCGVRWSDEAGIKNIKDQHILPVANQKTNN